MQAIATKQNGYQRIEPSMFFKLAQRNNKIEIQNLRKKELFIFKTLSVHMNLHFKFKIFLIVFHIILTTQVK